jgi:methyl-accepting chemotaxis protein
MKKTVKARHAGLFAVAFALFGWIAINPTAQAQYPERYRRDTLSNASYERMRQYAHEIGELAEHANEQAQAQQGGYRGFRRDRNFLKSIDHFAERAQRFHERMDTYRTQPWKVDDEIDHLLRDARDVQRRLQRARFVDRHTAEDWNRVVQLLNQMASEYRTGMGYGYPRRNGDRNPNAYPGDYGHPAPGSVPDPHRSGSYGDPYGGYGRTTDIRELADELDQRAARAASLAGRYNFSREYASNIQHLSEQARYFRDQIDNNQLGGSELRAQVVHLLEDAQAAQEEMRRMNVGPDLADEWNAIVQILTRMRDVARV